jgi:hypothetical protein
LLPIIKKIYYKLFIRKMLIFTSSKIRQSSQTKDDSLEIYRRSQIIKERNEEMKRNRIKDANETSNFIDSIRRMIKSIAKD